MKALNPTIVLIHGAGPKHYRSLKDGSGDWQAKLPQDFGSDFNFLAPQMPSPKNPSYDEWKILLDKYIARVKGDVIFVGHSLGGSFLLKYLSEEVVPRKILGLYIVAAPWNTIRGFEAPTNHSKLSGIKNIFLYHSMDDVEVPYAHAVHFQNVLDATLRTFSDRGHYFKRSAFPEIVRDIAAHTSTMIEIQR